MYGRKQNNSKGEAIAKTKFSSSIMQSKSITEQSHCCNWGFNYIKKIQGWHLCDCINHIVVKSFGEANCSDMEDYLKPVARKNPNI